MAKYRSTTFGTISGKHGTAVATVRNGKVILRVYTPPSNPNSPGQVSQRLKFGLVTSSLNPLRSIINVGFGSKSGFYQAVSLALRSAVEGNSPDFSISYAKVLVSSGSLPQSSSAIVTALANMNVNVAWEPATWFNGASTDSVHICFLNAETKMAVYMQEQAIRTDGQLAAQLPAPWKGSTIHVWLFFTSTNYKFTSVSQYLGTVVPA